MSTHGFTQPTVDARVKITAEQFKQAVDHDPAWASKLTEPAEITEFCDMEDSKITHLSPLLHFTGREKWGQVACFHRCKSLKVAEGTFHGNVEFNYSGIEKIGELHITEPDNRGYAASFWGCKSLKIAEGTFSGCVQFNYSGIEKIGKLIITHADIEGVAACFCGCKSLKIAEGTFPGFVNFNNSGVEEIDSLTIINPDKDGKYLQVEDSPIAENPKELRKVFQGKPLDELQTALHATQDDPVKIVLKSLIGRRVMRSSTPEIEI